MSQLRIFISYGRDQYAPLAARLAADLTAKGYEVWFDQELQSGRSWARGIQRQLRWLADIPENGRFIYLLTQHSTRDDSFCLSELQYAIDHHVPVFPIQIENCEIPIEIYPLQRIDFRSCLPVEEHLATYQRLLSNLVADMEGQIESRLAQQKVILDQSPQNSPPLRPVAPPTLQEETKPLLVPDQHSPAPQPELNQKLLRSVIKSGLGWGLVTIVVLLIIGITAQSQGFMAIPLQTEKPVPTLTPSSTPTSTITPSPTSLLVPPACTNGTQTWTSPVDGMNLLCVPAQEFLMGSTDADKDATPNEKPQHIVYLDGFWIDKTEVTNAMYQKCVRAGKCVARSTQGGDNFPQVYVAWNDAKAYCEWAERQLPSEAQWEKAARGKDGRIYPWGNTLPNATSANFNYLIGKTTSVGSYPAGASSYGALDMAGNVWEWVADWYSDTYYASQSSWSNPTGPVYGTFRVFRGGSWNSEESKLRVALRLGDNPANTLEYLGFRCAR